MIVTRIDQAARLGLAHFLGRPAKREPSAPGKPVASTGTTTAARPVRSAPTPQQSRAPAVYDFSHLNAGATFSGLAHAPAPRAAATPTAQPTAYFIATQIIAAAMKRRAEPETKISAFIAQREADEPRQTAAPKPAPTQPGIQGSAGVVRELPRDSIAAQILAAGRKRRGEL